MPSTQIIVADEMHDITPDQAVMSPQEFGPVLNSAFQAICKRLIGFDEVLLQAMLALATNEHVLWIAPPGRAKSLGAELIFSLFPDASLLSIQLTKEMPQSALFGQVIPKRLIETGEEVHNLEGGIADVEFAFLDEMLDASDWTLRSLLRVINERKFQSKSMGTIKAPLHSVIATTNFFKSTGALEAVVDRFLARAIIPAPDDIADWMRVGQVYLRAPGKQFDLPQLRYADLLAFAEWVESPDGITISPGLQMLHFLLMREFTKRRYDKAVDDLAQQLGIDPADPDNADNLPDARELGVSITPRSAVKVFDFVRAAAGLEGRDRVTVNDLRAAGYAYCVIGDDSGSAAIWKQTCDDLLNGLTAKHLSQLEKIAELSALVGQIREDKGRDLELNLHLAGKSWVVSRRNIRHALQQLPGNRHPAVQMAMSEVGRSIDELSLPAQTVGTSISGWA